MDGESDRLCVPNYVPYNPQPALLKGNCVLTSTQLVRPRQLVSLSLFAMLTEVEKGRSEPALIRTECANPCKPSVLSESAIEFNASVESPPAETPEHGPVYIEQDQAVSSEGQKAEVLIVGGGGKLSQSQSDSSKQT